MTLTNDEQRVAELLHSAAQGLTPIDLRQSALRAGRRRVHARRALTALAVPAVTAVLAVLVVSAGEWGGTRGEESDPILPADQILPAASAPAEPDCTGFPYVSSGVADYAAGGPADTTPPLQQAERWAAAIGLQSSIPGLVPRVAEGPDNGQVVFFTDTEGRARAIVRFSSYLDGWRLESETMCSSGPGSGPASSAAPSR